ncbi:MAG: hypothetical protein M1824_003409 [Vezdaea acicularis]|nr:MAG: hypothetical protein M1824_003409 [Vezdaea acicularis]
MPRLPASAATPSGGTRGPGRPSLGGKSPAGGGGKSSARGRKGTGIRRHRKIPKDNIRAITKGDIRRLARRGGVKRISAAIYDDVRGVIKNQVNVIMRDVCIFLDHANRKTVTVTDVIFALKRASTETPSTSAPSDVVLTPRSLLCTLSVKGP